MNKQSNNPYVNITDQGSNQHVTPKPKFDKKNLECNISGNLTSFDASRISPDNANNMNSSQNNQIFGLEKIVCQMNAWNPKEQDVNYRPPQNSAIKTDLGKQNNLKAKQKIISSPAANNQAFTDEILAYNLTNTFSTIQSLDGPLNALKKMSKKPSPKE